MWTKIVVQIMYSLSWMTTNDMLIYQFPGCFRSMILRHGMLHLVFWETLYGSQAVMVWGGPGPTDRGHVYGFQLTLVLAKFSCWSQHWLPDIWMNEPSDAWWLQLSSLPAEGPANRKQRQGRAAAYCLNFWATEHNKWIFYATTLWADLLYTLSSLHLYFLPRNDFKDSGYLEDSLKHKNCFFKNISTLIMRCFENMC